MCFPDLSVDQGIQQIRTFMKQVYHKTEPGELLQICLHNLQAEAGTEHQLLEELMVDLSYIAYVILDYVYAILYGQASSGRICIRGLEFLFITRTR